MKNSVTNILTNGGYSIGPSPFWSVLLSVTIVVVIINHKDSPFWPVLTP